ncbi:MAG: sulfatase [Alphaproteobacteria bacterium]|nr:sulfatase [Alphaproteobacteria bacterium]
MTIKRRTVLQGLAAAAAASSLPAASLSARASGDKPDVLLISIDDLNDWCGVLGGHPQARTPNIDRLAKWGTLFENAHCTAPACSPSRSSVLLGQRPTTTGLYENDQPMRRAVGMQKTLPQFFSKHGYETFCAGKVFHVPDHESFDEVWPKVGCSWKEAKKKAEPKDTPANGIRGLGMDWGPSRADRDGPMSDDMVADRVIKWLKRDRKQPTFIACGFFRPHLPWYVPQHYFDQYPLSQVTLPAHKPDDLDDIPMAGRRMARIDDHQRIVASDQWKTAVQGYLASLSFADAMLGRVLDALEQHERAKSTVVVLWSDHGWSLGTKMHWKKFALWEECTRVPLIVAGPGAGGRGQRRSQAVSLLDIFPTLTQLCGLPDLDRVEGESLVPLLRGQGGRVQPAVTTWMRGNHAVRSDRYRYIRYADGSEELYDHQGDPHEWTNRAADASLAGVKDELRAWIPKNEAPNGPRGEHDCGD